MNRIAGVGKVTDVFPSLWLPWSTEDRESTFYDGGTVRDAKQGGCHKVEKRGLSGLHQEGRRNGVLRRFLS